MKIHETKHFNVEAVDKPHIPRTDGGHIRIYPKKPFLDRTKMTEEQAIEFVKLTITMGKAFKTAMKNRGIELMRINYQDMGNWAFQRGEVPEWHMHLYGRAKNAKNQPYFEALKLPNRSTGYYDKFEPLNEDDVKEIQKCIE
ncbi:HIT domain-containing protein [Nanoarchaeota archaeon]